MICSFYAVSFGSLVACTTMNLRWSLDQYAQVGVLLYALLVYHLGLSASTALIETFISWGVRLGQICGVVALVQLTYYCSMLIKDISDSGVVEEMNQLISRYNDRQEAQQRARAPAPQARGAQNVAPAPQEMEELAQAIAQDFMQQVPNIDAPDHHRGDVSTDDDESEPERSVDGDNEWH